MKVTDAMSKFLSNNKYWNDEKVELALVIWGTNCCHFYHYEMLEQ